MNIKSMDTVVVGAGVVGVAIAERLQYEGGQILLLDRAGPGEACSSGNAGHFATDVVLPLANLQTIAALPKMLLDKRGPLSLRWSYLPQMLPWLARFAMAALPAQAKASAQALRALNSRSIASYESLLARTDLRSLMVQRGALTVYESAQAKLKHQSTVALLRDYGVNVEALSAAAVRELEPALGNAVAGGLYFPDTAHTVNPLRLTQSLARSFCAAGGQLQQLEVIALRPQNEGIAVLTESGAILAKRVVLAAGVWSGSLLRSLGLELPLDTERGYHLMLPEPGLQLSRPVTSHERSFVMTPMEEGLRLAGTVELVGLDAPPDYGRSEVLFEHAATLLPGLHRAKATRWMGMRPSLPDSLPVIGTAAAEPRLLFAFGHQHLGLTQAATTAELIADLVAGRAPAIDLGPYRIERFRGARSLRCTA
ncbi:FAD-dependent oxidoreductase [Parahaliea sp. F7430]|uniref:FAD-dependent oxidoreductase n=1 Tax=Sediminihaliea albiluteola TaxID=2758564 RepID=A0A7W2TXT4_9GAMM|nr:FAD-dependent oxidoreductase [Sediminihaliea albiluteola]MBA6413880.1 FAD-dependent oxidoreductase [Sediminihaliea albiluteola]